MSFWKRNGGIRRFKPFGGAALVRETYATALLYLDVNGPRFPVALFAAALPRTDLGKLVRRRVVERIMAEMTITTR